MVLLEKVYSVPPGPGTATQAWLSRAFETLPVKTGTLSDLAAALQADPDVAPKLDRRPDVNRLNVPAWRVAVSRMVSRHPEFVDTGRKRGGLKLFRYDEQIAQAARDGRRKRRV
ncbi:hypothetical protein GPECTOR_20g464 [Gonium pectorale]|uniref:Uncharacterized protein n=1 Tax=Gonium pectorale TaxID=33097 RepID=A0A150GIH5_GONPE|nr:hypothetical protein GPECTOR_20g464 [Gonium pectorale]|eukprot:KXZ49608.1 hypothetical protein GPECTOR_20g464 [Gonium pectorale]